MKTRFVIILIVALTGAAVPAAFGQTTESTPGAGQPQLGDVQAQTQALGRAIAALEADDVATCVQLLRAIVDQAQAGSILHTTSARLLSQITGAYRERQEFWWNRKVVDQVVIVPDEASFVEAIAAWPADRYWPVLIDDDWFVPLFIEAFGPSKVLRWSRPGADPAVPLDDREMLRRYAEAIRDRNAGFAAPLDPPPPGLVVIDVQSGQRAGGLALAMGRGQPIMVMRTVADAEEFASPARVGALNASIMRALTSLGMIRSSSWTAVTLAGPFVYRYEKPDEKYKIMSVDDALGRDDRLIRHAVIGRLHGDAVQSAYMAMASLFIQPRHALLVNTYGYSEKGNNDGKRAYHLTHAAATLARAAPMTVTLLQNDDVTVANFVGHTRPVPDHDLFLITSAFGQTELKHEHGSFGRMEMPTGRCMAMHVVASYSSAAPWDSRTLCAEALEGGTFWYYGSVNEPYLQAFVQSTAMVRRAAPGTPLAFAAKQIDRHPFARPWKLMLIGDPLYTLRDKTVERIAAEPPADCTDATAAPADDTLVARARRALLTGAPIDPADAKALLVAGEPLPTGLLGHAVRSLAIAGDTRAVAMTPVALTKRRPVVTAWTQPALMTCITQSIASGDLDDAADCYERLLAQDPEAWLVEYAAGPWVDAMSKAGRTQDAVRRINQWRDAATERRIRSALDKVAERASPR